jgi:SAM-dependent methyltransferase
MVTESPGIYWDRVYATRQAEKLGWYKPRLDASLAWISELDLPVNAAIIDVGGGASTLVDDLVDEGFLSITVFDIAESALGVSRKRLGHQAELVMWLCGDVRNYRLPEKRFDLWHDRAALHFLIEDDDCAAYRDNLIHSLKPGGYCIIGVFSPAAPPKCSGLPVRRYDKDDLARFLGDEFRLLRDEQELHVTPGGVEQMYVYCLFQRRHEQ